MICARVDLGKGDETARRGSKTDVRARLEYLS
jgi:hypothetical protein